MSPLDLLRTAFMNLWRRKLRAFLTVLGMVIGTASIVVMVSLGIGIRQSTMENYASMGSLTNITVNAYRNVQMDNGSSSTSQKKLDKKAVETFRTLPGVKAVMPRIATWGMLKSGRWVTDISILGIDSAAAETFGVTLSEGRYPQYKRGSSSYELVLGSNILEWFYNPDNGRQALNSDGTPKVSIDDRFQFTFDSGNIYQSGGQDASTPRGGMYRMDVVGRMSEESNEFSWYCLMDMETLKKLAKENADFVTLDLTNYNEVMVKCDSTDDVRAVKAAIDEMGYGTSSLQDALDSAEKNMQQIQYLLGAIGGVSLLVAAIGIMNTMMMSIYERTREIGIMKVLGCPMQNIAALFLTEAAYIGFFGGLLGLGVSYGLGVLINRLVAESGFRSIIPLYLAGGALVFSVLVAVVSGMYPAFRAMRLSPLNAIRGE